MKLGFASTLLVLAALCGHAEEAPDLEDQKNLQGTWVIESATFNGKPEPGVRGEMIFAGNECTTREGDGKEQKGTFKLDPAKKPKRLVFTPAPPAPKDVGNMAYELKGDELRLAMSPPDKEPVDLSDKGQLLIVLKRKPK
jgi:uncharacterized protein (TIGR03067 family)